MLQITWAFVFQFAELIPELKTVNTFCSLIMWIFVNVSIGVTSSKSIAL